MDIYVARQPIFDRNMNVFGYELLYRKSKNNYYEGSNDNQATAELINNSFLSLDLDSLTDGRRAFINFSEELLMKEIPLLLPKESIVIEILERVKCNEQLLEKCRNLRELGYLTALDDFKYVDEIPSRIASEVSIVKIDFKNMSFADQTKLLERIPKHVQLLAEKVETWEEYQQALLMGYHYFQGYFFSKPVIIKGKDLPVLNNNLIRIVSELKQEDSDYQRISEIIETDIGLSYKLLRMVNSAGYGLVTRIHSIKNALVCMGIQEIRKWVYLLMLKEIQTVENKELIKNSLIRAKFMELMSNIVQKGNRHQDFFLTGLFSLIDIMLDKSMEDIVGEIGVTDEVKKALLGTEETLISNILICVKEYERANWEGFEQIQTKTDIDKECFMEAYISALKWVDLLEAKL